MKLHRRMIGPIAVALTMVVAGTAAAQMGGGPMEGHQHMEGARKTQHEGVGEKMMAPRGGAIQATDKLQFETVFTESDVRIYVMNSEGMSVSPRKVKGTVSLKSEKGKATKVVLQWTEGSDDPVAANRARPGTMVNKSHGYLFAKYDSREVTDGSVTAHIMLSNLPVDGDKTAHWETSYTRTPLFGMACPMHPEQASLTDGKCSVCGGMAYQPASVVYGCCSACGDMRRTSPGKCEKCGMDLELKAVVPTEIPEAKPTEMRHSGH